MLVPSFASDFVSTWLAPIVGLIVSGLIVGVVTAVLSSRRDRRKEVEDEARRKAKEQEASKREAQKQRDALVTLLKDQVTEMHSALLGEPATDWSPARPGLVQRTIRIEGTLFGNGGVNNTVLDRLQRIERGQSPSEEDKDRPDERAERKHQL